MSWMSLKCFLNVRKMSGTFFYILKTFNGRKLKKNNPNYFLTFFKHFKGFWTKIQHFHTASTCIIFSNFAHHVDILLQSDFGKSHMLYDEKDADTVFHFFVANFLDNIVVLDTNAFQVFSAISFTFRPLFSPEYLSKPANQTTRNKN